MTSAVTRRWSSARMAAARAPTSDTTLAMRQPDRWLRKSRLAWTAGVTSSVRPGRTDRRPARGRRGRERWPQQRPGQPRARPSRCTRVGWGPARVHRPAGPLGVDTRRVATVGPAAESTLRRTTPGALRSGVVPNWAGSLYDGVVSADAPRPARRDRAGRGGPGAYGASPEAAVREGDRRSYGY
jgi:hypothetical protein